MPDLTDLLDANTDEIRALIVPEGLWDAEILCGEIYDQTPDGELPYSEKREDSYIKISLYLKCTSPVDVVDPAEADKFIFSGQAESTVEWVYFIWGKTKEANIASFTRRAERLGARTQGRSTREIVEGLQGQGVPARIIVEHEEFKGDVRAKATRLMPID